MILGFRPTQEASAAIGNSEEIIEWLKDKKPIAGTLHNDTFAFLRAYNLSREGLRTHVWQIEVSVSEDDFARIHQQALGWYENGTEFQYAFPAEELPPDRDNCATFPRRLGLPLYNDIGLIKEYIRILEQQGERWQPQGD